MEAQAEKYFLKCEKEGKNPTIGGLALHCGTHVKKLLDYQQRPQFRDSLKRIKLRIQEAWVADLKRQTTAGVMFYLKNAFREDFATPDAIVGGNVTYTWRRAETRGRKPNKLIKRESTIE